MKERIEGCQQAQAKLKSQIAVESDHVTKIELEISDLPTSFNVSSQRTRMIASCAHILNA